MSWLRKIFGNATEKKQEGIALGDKARWEVNGVRSPKDLFFNLMKLFPRPGYIMYFEGVVISDDVESFLREHSYSDPVRVAKGTLWPKPDIYHVPLTEKTAGALAVLADHHAGCEICDHFHVYKDNEVYLEWHDAWGDDPFLCSEKVSEDDLKVFCEKIGGALELYPGV